VKIQLEGVSLELRGRSVLKGITTSIDAGAFTCLLGPNGAGKTMLFRVLTGQMPESHGRVMLERVDASTLPRREVARRFAILPQGVQAPPYVTVRELVALGRFRSGNGLGWRLQQSDHAAIAASLGHCGVEQLADRPLAEMSGGEKQRAWLAFCLAQEKEFLFLDESLAALDYVAKGVFFRLLVDLATGGRGVFLVTHDVDMANRFATKIMVMQNGALTYDGPPSSDMSALVAPDQYAEAGA
jgi:iron complex transport system ATP-binding protein